MNASQKGQFLSQLKTGVSVSCNQYVIAIKVLPPSYCG